MNSMEKLAAEENKAAKQAWMYDPDVINEEVSRIFKISRSKKCQRIASAALKRHRMAEIINSVCDATGVTRAEVFSDTRKQPIAKIRQYAMWKCREQGYSLPQIGVVFGRDHSTVFHACKAIQQDMKRKEVAQ